MAAASRIRTPTNANTILCARSIDMRPQVIRLDADWPLVTLSKFERRKEPLTLYRGQKQLYQLPILHISFLMMILHTPSRRRYPIPKFESS